MGKVASAGNFGRPVVVTQWRDPIIGSPSIGTNHGALTNRRYVEGNQASRRAIYGIAAFVRTRNYVLFGANGYIEQSMRVAQQGRYRFVLWSKGTAVAGVYPVVSVQLNERELGRIECVGESWSPHELLTDLPTGPAVLRFAFTNDARRPPEDRNLWLGRIEIEHIESDS